MNIRYLFQEKKEPVNRQKEDKIEARKKIKEKLAVYAESIKNVRSQIFSDDEDDDDFCCYECKDESCRQCIQHQNTKPRLRVSDKQKFNNRIILSNMRPVEQTNYFKDNSRTNGFIEHEVILKPTEETNINTHTNTGITNALFRF